VTGFVAGPTIGLPIVAWNTVLGMAGVTLGIEIVKNGDFLPVTVLTIVRFMRWRNGERLAVVVITHRPSLRGMAILARLPRNRGVVRVFLFVAAQTGFKIQFKRGQSTEQIALR
jgi:hypothetical protein